MASPLEAFIDGRTRRARFAVDATPPAELAPVDGLLAGAAAVDITPPPGMPKAGYSANAHNGNGFRTRLRAHVLHLRAGTSSVALIQCDLLGGSSVVQHLVARSIADTTDVPLAGVYLGATHTHAGPGQFLGTDMYNRFASNQSGFDPGYTQFLVDQISGAVSSAVADRAPASIAVGSTDVWGLTRNRSLDPHVRNRTVGDTAKAPESKFHAINPALHLIRVDRVGSGGGGSGGGGSGDVGSGGAGGGGVGTVPLAAMVVFSVHGTGVPMAAHEYNADLWAYLVGELGRRIEHAHGTRPVVGAMEGTHADVAPALRPGLAGHVESARLGRAMGAAAAELYEQLGPVLEPHIELAAGFREIDLDVAANREIDGIELPRRPAVGASLVAGAHENFTPVVHRIPPFKAGSPKPVARANPHGRKWVLGTRWLQPVVLPLRTFPRVLPLHVLRLGDTMIVGLPFELTVETGRRIEQAVRDSVDGSGVRRVVVSSVTDEYSGYCATPEEYELQYYEGGHTIYGPNTQSFLTAHSARLAGEVALKGDVSDGLARRSFDLKVRCHLPRPEPDPPDRTILVHARYHDMTATEDGYWELQWVDAAPGNLSWHEPIVRVDETSGDSAGWRSLVDDSGWELQVTQTGAHLYSVRWWDPPMRGDRRYRFVLLANNGRPERASTPFG